MSERMTAVNLANPFGDPAPNSGFGAAKMTPRSRQKSEPSAYSPADSIEVEEDNLDKHEWDALA
jgi:hypothetical protein